MPNQEVSMPKLSAARFYGSLDMLQGYWQLPLSPEVQDIFTIATPDGLYTPTRVPQGLLNATLFFPDHAHPGIGRSQLHGVGW